MAAVWVAGRGVPQIGSQRRAYGHSDPGALRVEWQNFGRPIASGSRTLAEARERFS